MCTPKPGPEVDPHWVHDHLDKGENGRLQEAADILRHIGEVLRHIEDVDTPDLQAQGADIDLDPGLQDPTDIGKLAKILQLQLSKMNITPLAILGVKWPFSKGHGR